VSNPALLEAVPGDDPCGPDMRWEPEVQKLAQDFDTLINDADDAAVVGAEVAATDQPRFEDIAFAAEDLCRKTKDVGILAIYAEACWRDRGLADFADAMDDFAAVVEQWADPDAGLHPRADPEDGHLGERTAPLGKMLLRLPSLAATVGWGQSEPEISVRTDASARLRAIFQDWQARFEPAFGSELPSKENAWNALRPLLVAADGVDSLDEEDDADPDAPAAAAAPPPSANAWDLVERAAELMAEQEQHSPALPMLRLIATWRSRDLVEIMQSMSQAGTQLEQLLQSMKQQFVNQQQQ